MTEHYARLESYTGDLECEHTDNDENRELISCDSQAEFTISSPLWSDETRTRYCNVHVIDALEMHMKQLKDNGGIND